MGIDGKAKLTVIHHIGAANEGTGTVTGNEDPKRDGHHEQARPKLPKDRDRVKDAAADIGAIRDAAEG